MSLTNTMKSLSESERPYEKCEQFGASHLTDTELLAVLLRTGSHGENALDLSKERLKKIRGIGRVKSIQILCISELAKRLAKAEACEMLQFTCPSSIARYYMEDMRHEKQEIMKLLMLNSKSRLIGETDISKGTVNAALITPRELFIEALQKNAVSIILLHNHPSGDPTPSREDMLLTERIRQAGELIGIELLDHIVMGDNCYISFSEQELLCVKGQ